MCHAIQLHRRDPDIFIYAAELYFFDLDDVEFSLCANHNVVIGAIRKSGRETRLLCFAVWSFRQTWEPRGSSASTCLAKQLPTAWCDFVATPWFANAPHLGSSRQRHFPCPEGSSRDAPRAVLSAATYEMVRGDGCTQNRFCSWRQGIKLSRSLSVGEVISTKTNKNKPALK